MDWKGSYSGNSTVPFNIRIISAFFHPLIITSFPGSRNSYRSNIKDAVLSSQQDSYDEVCNPYEQAV